MHVFFFDRTVSGMSVCNVIVCETFMDVCMTIIILALLFNKNARKLENVTPLVLQVGSLEKRLVLAIIKLFTTENLSKLTADQVSSATEMVKSLVTGSTPSSDLLAGANSSEIRLAAINMISDEFYYFVDGAQKREILLVSFYRSSIIVI